MNRASQSLEQVSDEWVRSIQEALLVWGPQHFQRFPWRRKLPLWQGLLVEVFLQRTRANQVIPVFQNLRQRFPRASDLSDAPDGELQTLVRGLGLHWRGRLLLQLFRRISELGGRLPLEQAKLEQLPGVGPYAAAAALSLHSKQRAVIIDANIVRILARLVGESYDGETRRKRWLKGLAELLTPRNNFRAYNYALIDLGMLLCFPTNPRCNECPLVRLCVTGNQSD